MWDKLLSALALVMIIEGLWPFVSPDRWRNALLRIVTLDNRALRVAGLASMCVGLLVLHLLTY